MQAPPGVLSASGFKEPGPGRLLAEGLRGSQALASALERI